jgi:nicotinate-nucleotide adenylyltransferase
VNGASAGAFLANSKPQRIILPPHAPGLRIALLGGSFNPAHAAHRAISVLAMQRLRVDRVWWVVSPGNPLKDTRHLAPLAERMAQARKVAQHPRIDITDLEAQIGTRYTVDTLEFLVRRLPRVHLVWLMGADILGELHRWRDWQRMAMLVPLAVVDRGGSTQRFLRSPAAMALESYRLPEARAAALPFARPPAWIFLHGPKSALSSTQLRRKTVTGGVETAPLS